MEIVETIVKIEVSVILQYGIDFQEDDIEYAWGTTLKEIKSNSLVRIAKEYHYDNWAHQGFIKADGSQEVKFYRITQKFKARKENMK